MINFLHPSNRPSQESAPLILDAVIGDLADSRNTIIVHCRNGIKRAAVTPFDSPARSRPVRLQQPVVWGTSFRNRFGCISLLFANFVRSFIRSVGLSIVRSVGRSVGWSVGRSVGWSVGRSADSGGRRVTRSQVSRSGIPDPAGISQSCSR